MHTPQIDDDAARRSEQIWLRRLIPYRTPSRKRALFELLITVVPFLMLWSAALLTTASGNWWGLVFTVPGAAFLVRLFMIQHDCGHGSFFGHRPLDDWTGRIIGVLTFTPYECWRMMHATHHASSGNLDARGVGDVRTLTVAEYRSMGRWGRLGYWLYRNPVVMFGLGPAFLFLLQQRLPIGAMSGGLRPWTSVMGTNVAIIAIFAGFIWLVGLLPFLLVQGPIILMAATIGVWLFYVQHQFEDTRWDRRIDWEFVPAALRGSSFYDLPQPLQWFSANVGIHHVHHVSSRVPFYRLPQVLKAYPELRQIGHISFLEGIRSVPLVLWDETQRRLISFREARRLARG